MATLSRMTDAEATANPLITATMEGGVESETLRAFTMTEVSDTLEALLD